MYSCTSKSTTTLSNHQLFAVNIFITLDKFGSVFHIEKNNLSKDSAPRGTFLAHVFAIFYEVLLGGNILLHVLRFELCL
jgi:hypothetical protein